MLFRKTVELAQRLEVPVIKRPVWPAGRRPG